MSLLVLPNEILKLLLALAEPPVLVNLALSCHLIHAIAEPELRLHNIRKGEYSNFFCHGCYRHGPDHKDTDDEMDQEEVDGSEDRDEGAKQDGEDSDDQEVFQRTGFCPSYSHPLRLIQDICDDFRVAFYLKSLSVDCCIEKEKDLPRGALENLSEDEREEALFVRGTMGEHRDEVRDLLDRCGYYTPKCVNQLCRKIERGSRGAMLGLLLLVLPNLRLISLDQYTWNATEFKDILTDIVVVHRICRGVAGRPLALSKLTDVRIHGPTVPNVDAQIKLQDSAFFNLFSRLPTVRNLHAHQLSDWHWGHWSTAPPKSSAVRRIVVRWGRLQSYSISQCLRRFQALEVFSYSYEALEGDFTTTDVGKVISVLQELFGHCLKKLEIFCGRNAPLPGHLLADDGDGRASLKGFQVLTTARLSCYNFLRKVEFYDGANDDNLDLRAWKTDIQPLIHLLPTSLEKVRFEGRISIDEVTALLRGLGAQKAMVLPLLKEIHFEEAELDGSMEHGWMSVALVKMCKGVGITLKLGED